MGSWFSSSEDPPHEDVQAQSLSENQSYGNEGKKTRPLTIVKDILKNKVKVNEEERKRNMDIVLSCVDQLIGMFRTKDYLFKELFSRRYETGSSFEGLRIKDANEFDIDLVFDLNKFKPAILELIYSYDVPGFVKCELIEDWLYSNRNRKDIYEKLMKQFAVGNCFMPRKMRSWLQSIRDKVNVDSISHPYVNQCLSFEQFSQQCLQQSSEYFRFTESGPATTLWIKTTFGSLISVDLVPVLEFRSPHLPLGVDEFLINGSLHYNSKFWFIVPKPYRNDNYEIDKEEASKLWRIHFPEIEKAIIHNKGCAKPVIKLLKLCRDGKGWDVLCSYFLKTIVMSKLRIDTNSDWNECYMHLRFLECLKILLECLKCREIPHIFFPRYNLLKNIDRNHAKNIENNLRKSIAKIEADFSNIYTAFNL